MVGIICAMTVEVEGIIAKMQNPQCQFIAKMVFTSGTIGNTEVVAVECGVGKVNAAMCTQIMIDTYHPDVIVNSGVAGALDTSVTIGDTIVGTAVIQHDMNTSALGEPLGTITIRESTMTSIPADTDTFEQLAKACEECGVKYFEGKIATGDIFVASVPQRKKIYERFSALACEMEGAAVGHVCYRNEVNYGILRVISDDLTKSDGMDFVTFCKMAADKSISVITKFIENYLPPKDPCGNRPCTCGCGCGDK